MSKEASKECKDECKNVEENALITTAEMPDIEFLKSLGQGALDSLGQEDIIMPRYKLIQNTSKTGTPGMWVSNLDSDKELEELNIVILEISNFRTYFPEAGQGDRPLCRSNDGYRKAEESGVGDGICNCCRYSVWCKDDRGRPIPPKCQAGYTVLALIILPDGSMEPGFVSFKGTAIRPSKKYWTRMKSRGVAPYTYITNIRSAQQVNDKGRFFSPVFDFGPWLNRETIEFAAQQAALYKQYVSPDAMADNDRDDERGGTVNASRAASHEFLEELEENVSVEGVKGQSGRKDKDAPADNLDDVLNF